MNENLCWDLKKWNISFLTIKSRDTKLVSGAFSQSLDPQSREEICFYFYLILRPKKGKEGECPRAEEVRDHLE